MARSTATMVALHTKSATVILSRQSREFSRRARQISLTARRSICRNISLVIALTPSRMGIGHDSRRCNASCRWRLLRYTALLARQADGYQHFLSLPRHGPRLRECLIHCLRPHCRKITRTLQQCSPRVAVLSPKLRRDFSMLLASGILDFDDCSADVSRDSSGRQPRWQIEEASAVAWA